MLSVSVFILAMIQQYQAHQHQHEGCLQIKVQYVSDNLELINKGKEYKGYDDPYPSGTLRAEYDVTEQIY